MTTVNLPLNISFYDVMKLTCKMEKSPLPGIDGVLFCFNDYLKGKIVEAYLTQEVGECTSLFFFNKECYCLVCKGLTMDGLHKLEAVANEERKSLADKMHLAFADIIEQDNSRPKH